MIYAFNNKIVIKEKVSTNRKQKQCRFFFSIFPFSISWMNIKNQFAHILIENIETIIYQGILKINIDIS